MAVQRRENWVSQQRVDLPDMRSIESATSNDFDQLLQALILGTNEGYVLRGFEISMIDLVHGAASNAQMIVANSAVLHPRSSQSGTYLIVRSNAPNQIMNSATNPIVSGAFAPNALNYVGIEFTRAVDDTTDAQVYIWDPTSNDETTKLIPRAQILSYKIVITTGTWAANVLPIAIITTDSGNNVLTVEDQRRMLNRLGTAGRAAPNPFYTYPWTAQPEGRVESNFISSTNSINPFHGGDKMLGNDKDWKDAVMSAIKEIKGSAFWYTFGSTSIPGVNLTDLFFDAAGSVLTMRGKFVHSKVTPGMLTWSGDLHLRSIIGPLTYIVPAGNITLADGEVGYITLIRDELFQPTNTFTFTNGSSVITATSVVANIFSGDWIKFYLDDMSKWVQVQTVVGNSITLYSNYLGTSGVGFALRSQGTYTMQQATPANVPASGDTFWIAKRDDNGLITANIASSPTGAVRVDGVTTFLTTAPHGLNPGQVVSVLGVTDTTFNDFFEITSTPTTSTLTVVNTGPDATSGGGIINSTATIYLRGIGELAQGSSQSDDSSILEALLQYIGSPNAGDTQPQYSSTHYATQGVDLTTAIGKLDARLWLTVLEANNDRNLDLVRGGIWDFATPTLSWSKDAAIQIPGLPENRNNIPAGSIAINNDGDVAYVNLNRVAGAPANLTVSTAAINSPAMTDDNILVIARRFAIPGISIGTVVGSSAATAPANISIDNNRLYEVASNSLKIYNIAALGATNPVLLGTGSPGGTGATVVIAKGNVAVVAGNSGMTLNFFDVSNPATPTVASLLALPANTHMLGGFINGIYLYAFTQTYVVAPPAYTNVDLRIIDISNIFATTQVGTLASVGSDIPLTMYGSLIYNPNHDTNQIRLINVANPALPVFASPLALAYSPTCSIVVGSALYVGDITGSRLVVYDLTNPAVPSQIGTLASISNPKNIRAETNLLAINNPAGNLYLINISTPASPSLSFSGGTQVQQDLEFNGNYLYAPNNANSSIQIYQAVAIPASSTVIVNDSMLLQSGEAKELESGMSIQNRTYTGVTSEFDDSPVYPSPIDLTVVKDGDPLNVAIGEIDTVLSRPVYDERLKFPTGLLANTPVPLPVNSRNGGAPQTYAVKAGLLQVYVNQLFKFQSNISDPADWNAIDGSHVSFPYDLPNDSVVHFRIATVGGFKAAGSGTEGLQDAYDFGSTITIASGVPVTISGPPGQKLLVVNGDMDVTGVIDPKGLQLDPQSANPLAVSAAGLWADLSGKLNYTDGTTIVNISQKLIDLENNSALRDLSNLTATAINQSLKPGTGFDNSLLLGDATHRWASLHNLIYNIYGSTSGVVALKAANSTTSYNLTLPPAVATATGQALTSDTSGVLSWTTITTPTTFLDNVFRIQNFLDPTKQLGFDAFAISPSQTRIITVGDYNISLKTDTTGTFATKALDNLASTAVNVDILPVSNNTKNLGSGSLQWAGIYTNLVQSVGALQISSGGILNIGASSYITFAGTILRNIAAPLTGSDLFDLDYLNAHAPVFTRRTVADANATIASTDHAISLTSATVTRTFTLPLANSVVSGYEIIVQDESNALSPTINLIIQRAGADTVNGATSATLNFGYAKAVFKSDGISKWFYQAVAAAGANTTLSNLTNPTSINQDLLPQNSGINVGTHGSFFNQFYGTSVIAYNGLIAGDSTLAFGKVEASPIMPSGTVAQSALTAFGISGTPANIGLYTQSNSTANATATAHVLIESGNKTAGTGGSGDIIARIGTSSGGARGKIRHQDGSEGIIGQIWVSTDVTGGGHWAAPAASAPSVVAGFYISSPITTRSSAVSSTTFTTFSNSPTLTFTPTISGSYRIYCNAPIENSSSTNIAVARINNTVGAATLLAENQSTEGKADGSMRDSIIPQSYYTLTAGTSYSFVVQGKSTAGASNVFLDGTVSPAQIFGEMVNDLQVSTVVTTLSAAIPTPPLTFAAFSNSPTLTFTPTISGTYRVHSEFTLIAFNDASSMSDARIFNTAGGATLLAENQASVYIGASVSYSQSVSPQSTYTLTAGTSYSFVIQGRIGQQDSNNVFADGSKGQFYLIAERLVAGTQISAAVTTRSAAITSSTFTTFSNSPTLTFTAPVSGLYKLYSVVPMENDGVGPSSHRIFNSAGGATLVVENQTVVDGITGQGVIYGTVAPTSIYNLNAGSSYSFVIQGLTTSPGVHITAGHAQAFIYAEWIQVGDGGGSTSGFATTSLNNLAATAVNANILPAVDGTTNLGSASKGWADVYFYNIHSPGQLNIDGTTVTITSGLPNGVAFGSTATPLTDGAQNLGTSALRWGTIHTKGETLYGATSGNVNIQAAAVTTNYSLKWPAAQGSAGTFPQNDGSGNLSWVAASGGNSAPYTAAGFLISSPISDRSTAVSSTVTPGTGAGFTTFSNSATLKFTPSMTGTYRVYATATVENNSASNTGVVRISNSVGAGTLLAENRSSLLSPQGTGLFHQTVTPQSMYTLLAGTEYSFVIQGGTVGGASNIFLDGTSAPIYICAEFINQSFISTAVTTQSSSFTSSSYANFSNTPTLTFTPTVSGTYKLWADASLTNTNNGSGIYGRINNTTGGATLLSQTNGVSYSTTNGNCSQSCEIKSIYTLTAGTSYTFDIQGLSTAGQSSFLDGSKAQFYMFASLIPEVFVGSGLGGTSANLTANAAYAEFNSVAPTLTFTPNTTGTYRISTSLPLQTNSGTSQVRIFNKTGGASLILQNPGSGGVNNGANGSVASVMSTPTQSLFSLIAGVAYSFVIQGQSSGVGTTGPLIQNNLGGPGSQFGIYAELVQLGDSGNTTAVTVYPPDAVQTLAATFTIAFNNTYTPVTSAGAVSSSTTVPIAAGSFAGQKIMIENRGTFVITLKTGGNAKLPQALDYALGQFGMITFIWNGTNWITQSASANN